MHKVFKNKTQGCSTPLIFVDTELLLGRADIQIRLKHRHRKEMSQLFILPHEMSSSAMKLQFGGIQVFADCTHVNKRKHNVSTILAAFQTCLSSSSNRSTCTWRITAILIAEKTQIPPIGPPYWDKDGAGYGISGLYLWVKMSTKCDLVQIYLQIESYDIIHYIQQILHLQNLHVT